METFDNALTGDFRDRAVAASLAAIRRTGGSTADDASRPGISYCLQRTESTRGIRTILRCNALAIVVVALPAIAMSPLFLVPASPLAHYPWSLALGIVLAISGLGLLVSLPPNEARIVQGHILRTVGDYRLDPNAPAFPVRVEDTHTWQKLKAIAEDLGVIRFFAESQCVQIEGVFYRYLIYANDVKRIEQVRSGTNEKIHVSYQIGSEVLELTLTFFNIAAHEQASGGFCGHLRRVLTPDAAGNGASEVNDGPSGPDSTANT